MSERCGLCGRLAVRLEAGYCSARCRELAAGYVSPRHAAAALAAPATTYQATLLVTGPLPEALPTGCAPIGRTGARHLLRLGADSWDDLDAAIDEVAGACGEDAVEIFTLQQFAGGGLAPTSPIRRGTT
jgi:hypothetical protein